jgi:DHA3 family macrolide efflux protein-like MFS transporter
MLPHWKRRFFTIWIGQAFSLLGSQVVGFALIWWLTKTSGSATVLATASLVGLVPQVVLGPIAGTLVDRWNRRMTMIVADAIIALATLVLAVLFWAGFTQIWHVYLLMFIRSVAGGFHWPASTASTSLMVPKEHLARIQGLNSVLSGSLNIVAAPLGALLLEYLAMHEMVMADVFTALLAIVPLFFVSIPQPERKLDSNGAAIQLSFWEDFKLGWKYMIGWKGLMMIGGMALVINFLLSPAFSLMPILVTKHFSGGALQLAWTESAFGIGIIVGGLLLGVWGGFKRRIYTSLVGVFGIGLGCLVIGFAPAWAYPLALAAMLWLGVVNPIANGPLHAALQAAVDPDMQGRAFTLLGSVASAMSPLGLMIAGPLADLLGVQAWFIIGGCVTLFMAASAFFVREIVHFEDGRVAASAEQPARLTPAPEKI